MSCAPVNILLGKNQVMLSQERSAEEYQQALVDNIEELEDPSSTDRKYSFWHARSTRI